LWIQQQGFDSVRERVGFCLIDKETASSARDFTKRAIAAANARLSMEKTFGNRQPETFHQRRINRETTFAISAQERFVVDVTQPAQRSAAHPKFPDLPDYFVEWRADIAANQRQIESYSIGPELFRGLEQFEVIFTSVKRADVKNGTV